MTRVLNKMDKVLLILTVVMFIFGLFMILDASSMKSFIEDGTNTKYFMKQLIIIIISFILSIFIIMTPTKKYKKSIVFITVALIIMLMYLVVSGVETAGAKSWIYIGSFGLQPSELAKIALIVFMGVYYRANVKYLNSFVPSLIPVGVGAIYTLLTLLQPDGGTGLILFFITVLLFYASPVKKEIKIKSTLYVTILIVIGFLGLLIIGKSPFSSVQESRFNFTKPCTRYQENTGYQVCNGYIAINNGKLISISPGNSSQKYLYLPEAFTDFIFPIIVEEFGLITGILVILIFMFMIYRILIIARNSVNICNALICYGVACYIALHVIINLGGVFGLIPLTGVPLPFLSYGGSFMLCMIMALSIVQRVNIETRIEKDK